MVKKQQQLGGLASLFSSSNNKPQQVDATSRSSSSMLSAASASSSSSSSAWQWQWRPSCGLHPRTLSFRQQQQLEEEEEEEVDADGQYLNSAYSVDSCFSNSLASVVDSFSTASEASAPVADAEAAVVRALRSDRLFFEPEDAPSSFRLIKKKATSMSDDATVAFGGAMAMSVESRNPYRDFRESMEAMVMSHVGGGAEADWRWLEEMLGWYLRANGKSTHGLIVGAFVDLLVALSTTSPPPASSSA